MMRFVKQNFRDKIKCRIWNAQQRDKNTMIISPDTSPSKTVDLTKLKVQATASRLSKTPIIIKSVKLRYERAAGASTQWSFRQKKVWFLSSRKQLHRHVSCNNWVVVDKVIIFYSSAAGRTADDALRLLSSPSVQASVRASSKMMRCCGACAVRCDDASTHPLGDQVEAEDEWGRQKKKKEKTDIEVRESWIV